MSSSDVKRRGLLLVLSSPSGAGKTTLSKRLLEQDEQLSMSISVTTRQPRPGEVDGKDYIFVGEETFQKMASEGAFLEHAVVFGNHYGTPRQRVEEVLSTGNDVLFDIDWQGTQQLNQAASEDLVKVFILPPSWAALKERLQGRAQDSDEVVAARMEKAVDEISHWAEYDYVIVNDDLDRAFDQLQAILSAERRRLKRQVGLADFVNDIMGQAS